MSSNKVIFNENVVCQQGIIARSSYSNECHRHTEKHIQLDFKVNQDQIFQKRPHPFLSKTTFYCTWSSSSVEDYYGAAKPIRLNEVARLHLWNWTVFVFCVMLLECWGSSQFPLASAVALLLDPLLMLKLTTLLCVSKHSLWWPGTVALLLLLAPSEKTFKMSGLLQQNQGWACSLAPNGWRVSPEEPAWWHPHSFHYQSEVWVEKI